MAIWVIPEKIQTAGGGNKVEFPGVFVFSLGISKGSNTILWNIQELSFVLTGISRGKVKK